MTPDCSPLPPEGISHLPSLPITCPQLPDPPNSSICSSAAFLRVNLALENESIYHLLFLITAGTSQAIPWLATGGWKEKKWDGTSTEAPALPTPSPCCPAQGAAGLQPRACGQGRANGPSLALSGRKKVCISFLHWGGRRPKAGAARGQRRAKGSPSWAGLLVPRLPPLPHAAEGL